MIRLSTLGSVDLRAPDGRVLAGVLAQPKRVGLLVYLAVARPATMHRRDRLLALFWPELDDARARDALSQALRFLRQALGPELFTSRGADEVGVDRTRLWCDAAAFREAMDAGDAAAALEHWGGDFLDGFFFEEASGFEEWAEGERASLRELAARGARQLAEDHEARGAHTVAVAWGRRAVELAPDDERAFRRLLGFLDRAGDRVGALQAYEAFAHRLRAEYNAEPAAETRAMVEVVRRKALGPSVAVAAPPKPPVLSSIVDASRRTVGLHAYADPVGVGSNLANGRYVIEGPLGVGGMATVYLAQDVRHQRKVAVKVLRPEIAAAIGADGLLREIRIAAGLQHPHIVPVFDSGETGGQVFYVMPYVAGESLRTRLQREPRLPIAVALRIARDMADALAYAHSRGFVHRDIKPDNVLLSGDPATGELHASIADFGVARAIDTSRSLPAGPRDGSLTGLGLVGTPAYMAPEQATGAQVDRRADLYAWGVVVHEMLAGEHPFAGRSTPQELIAAHISETPAPLNVRRADAPPSLVALVTQCLRKEPQARPEHGRELLAALDRASALTGPGVVKGWWRRSRVALAIVAAIGSAVAGVGWVGWRLKTGRGVLAAEAPRFNAGSRPGLDTLKYAVMPFTYDTAVTVPLNEVERLRDGLSRWSGIAVVDPLRLRELLSERGAPGTNRARAQRIAAELGAGRYVLGIVTGLPDGLRVDATLVDTRTNLTLRSAAARVSRPSPPLDSVLSGVADSLLLGGQGIGARGARPGTRSLAALRAFSRAHDLLREWDLTAADSAFAVAAQLDAQYAEAYLWLSLVRLWDDAPPVTWRIAASEAARLRARLPSTDQLVADAVTALSGDDAHTACGVWKRLTTLEPNDFSTWYGLGHCLRTDSIIVRDARSPSGWRFRSSFHHAFLAYRRAFDLIPSLHKGFSRGAYQRTRRLLLVATGTDVTAGRPLPPDTGRFLAYPGLSGDSLLLIPFPAQHVREARPGTVPPSLREAVKQQRGLFYSVASAWAAAYPRSPHALEALALSLELLGDRSALDVLSRARSLATDPDDRVRLSAGEVWLRLKFAIPVDLSGVRTARALADSILRAAQSGNSSEARYLAGLAALTGRAATAATHSQAAPLTSMENAPPSLARDALALLAFASLGGPADSLGVIERRVQAAIDRSIPLSARRQAELRWLLRPTALAFPAQRLASLATLSGTGWAVMEAQLALVRHDTSAVKRTLATVGERRRPLPPEDWTFDALYPEAWLLATVGDDRAAMDRLDPTLRTLPAASPEVLSDPARAASLVRAMALRAELASRANERDDAARWAAIVVALWSDADPFLQPTVRRMRLLAATRQ